MFYSIDIHALMASGGNSQYNSVVYNFVVCIRSYYISPMNTNLLYIFINPVKIAHMMLKEPGSFLKGQCRFKKASKGIFECSEQCVSYKHKVNSSLNI